ncbi:thiopeptide-type bacteriocin biosynthesis protein [Streptomyces sp. MUM 2J]|uniref:thiopeptide-type bacteriocin biosynthesis protein n=1 Tax=Streptomyces sp. MUM 2J TaxID=2791987 RepID=UPI001F036683|nr:thiopeptide-type bacteriocin biosynthesis protein [Streptomyces sp. MUM 2J]MCH0566938.1 thiopeptide-type bacteriocin biosynthesis protein [Streptomyces sp. MUM 2J]
MHDTDRIEDAVLAVLGGTSVEEAARAADTEPAQLSEAIERYRDAGRAALDAEPSGWHQANIHFADYPTAARAFRAYLAPALRSGPVGTWWFIRKHPHWRLRYCPAPDASPEDAVRHISEALDSSVSWGVTTDWASTRYEPETIAFGGPAGMALAHTLFHTDSMGVLDYLHAAADGQPKKLDAKATSLLAMTLMMRAAGLEFGEQGDVWGRVEQRRPLAEDVPPERVSTMVEPLRRLLLSDARPLLDGGDLASIRPWAEGLERDGRALADAAESGTLSLGKRGILARHVIFHWNRMGFALRQQSIWSRAAREAVLGG